MQFPTQGPMFFPEEKTGQDPMFLLTRNSTDIKLSKKNESYGSMKTVKNIDPYPATGNFNDYPEKNSNNLGRTLGLFITLIACFICVLGIVNIIYSSLSLASNSWGCLNSTPENYFSSTLGPSSPSMLILTWIWISAGMWAAIPPFVTGLALIRSKKSKKKIDDPNYNLGVPTELQFSQNSYTNAPDIYRTFAIFSITFCLPVCSVLAIIDSILSNYCKNTGNILKLILPIAVLLLAIIEFVVILLSWYKCKELSDNEYQYIGSTYTVYETYEPVYEKKNLVSTLETTPVHDSCCNGSQPVVIVNQQPISQQPVLPMILPSRPVVKVPVPIKIPVKIPFSGRPPVKYKSFVSQQRYYPSQVYGPNFGKSPNTYGKMYLPPPGTYHVNSAYTAFNI